jgi:hypothetical protein
LLIWYQFSENIDYVRLHDNLGFNLIIHVNIVMAREMGRGARGRGRSEGELLPPNEIPYTCSLLTGQNPTHASNRAYDEVILTTLLIAYLINL